MLNGEYSLDGGEWNKIDNEKPVDQHFKKAVFRGKLIDDLDAYSIMNVFSKNVWYTLYDEKGNELRSYQPLVSNTPGYYVNQVNIEDILSSAKGDVTLEVECPSRTICAAIWIHLNKRLPFPSQGSWST